VDARAGARGLSPSGAPLVTGGAGFAGRHLVEHLRSLGREPSAPASAELDLTDAAAVQTAVSELQPGAVFHLAALASPARSWKTPAESVLRNVEMTVNLLEAMRREAPEAPVLLASSGQVYGAPEQQPISEDAPLRPQSPYAVSKAACDLMGSQYADSHDLRVVRMRAFNHAGPGQSDEYVVSTLARQVAEAELEGRGEALLRTGDVRPARDFTDVRDVVRAYALAIELPPDPYNVCSGSAVSVAELIELLREPSQVEIRREIDEARLRPAEVMELRGSPERLRGATGWEPRIPLADTVRDALEDWRARLRA
jgi:GDP-4-dehydro-6-deoxy-D-mannose reductase